MKIDKKKKEMCISMYLDDEKIYDAMKGLGNFGAVWAFVMNNFNKDNIMFYFSKTVREDACKATRLSDGTVRSAINSFCEKNMLLKLRSAEYMVNPSFFYVGTWDNRPSMIERYEDKRLAKQTLDGDKRLSAKTI